MTDPDPDLLARRALVRARKAAGVCVDCGGSLGGRSAAMLCRNCRSPRSFDSGGHVHLKPRGFVSSEYRKIMGYGIGAPGAEQLQSGDDD